MISVAKKGKKARNAIFIDLPLNWPNKYFHYTYSQCLPLALEGNNHNKGQTHLLNCVIRI